jgi:glutathione peroxidase
MANISEHTVTDISGEPVALSSYRGKTLLIVNTASKCGYTKQYAGLQALHEAYAPRGLVVMGFPCNDFGAQEPGTEDEILSFCKVNYGVDFPMFSKVTVKGAAREPLFGALTQETEGELAGEIRWNFTKFLVDATGEVVGRFEPGVSPDSAELREAIEAALPG